MSIAMIKYVVFSSGALGGISLVGCWRALEHLSMSKNIIGVSGCSMGSIVATLVSIGYNSAELETVAMNVKYDQYADHSFRSLSKTYGIESGRRIIKLMDRLIKFKTGRKNLTFKDHWRLTGRQLWINASNVEAGKCEYYSVHTAPDMLVTDAIRRSISVPFLFSSVRTNQGTFVDGACYDPVPAHMFPKQHTICLNVRNSKDLTAEEIKPVDNLFEFSSSLLHGMFKEFNTMRFNAQEREGYKMIYVRTGIGSLIFGLTPEQVKQVIDIGYESVTKFY
jgi:NTE family protein